MKESYSIYEAKARLSALVREVRKGRSVTITVNGEPAAELRPIAPRSSGIEARLADLEERGLLVRAPRPDEPIRPGKRQPGALERFLESRD